MTDLSSSMAGSAVVQMDGAISLIDQFPALAGLDLVVEEGEIVLVRGANGAGKSTLLRLCAGLAPLSGGSGQVLGHDLSNRDARRTVRRETGLLAHETFLYDELTVEENLLFWAAANRVAPETIEPILDRLALGGRLRHVKVARLSAGQRRRTSLAVMVCRRPKLWLLDEPHGGLDQAGRDFVDDLINHAIGFGATVLIASHDIERATELATRTVTISGGLIQGQRPPTAGVGSDRSAHRVALAQPPPPTADAAAPAQPQPPPPTADAATLAPVGQPDQSGPPPPGPGDGRAPHLAPPPVDTPHTHQPASRATPVDGALAADEHPPPPDRTTATGSPTVGTAETGPPSGSSWPEQPPPSATQRGTDDAMIEPDVDAAAEPDPEPQPQPHAEPEREHQADRHAP